MLDVGTALLISETQIQFTVPIDGIPYPDYLFERGRVAYDLQLLKQLSEIEGELKRIQQAGSFSMRRVKARP